jgi:cell pole-organizing protein PopZ
MPIPDRGPVSLVPGQAQPHVHEPEDERETAEHMEAEGGGDQPHRLGEREAAVAAIAESLARTAAGAMNPEELATAGDVDFSKLGEEQKAEVTETFANAIHRESAAPHDRNPLPTLLDEVLRQDFIRELSPGDEPAEDSSETEASGAHEENHQKLEDERFAPRWGAPEIAFQAAASREPVLQVRSEPSPRASETLAAQEKAPVKIAPAPQPEPERAAESGSPLEAAVRDMLRPLLEKWLDEHMPRVLESAIREEIAARGLLPKTEK